MKFSIRQMLIAMVVMALFAAAAGAGANGSPLGYGIAVALMMLLLFFATFAAIYWSAWAYIRIFHIESASNAEVLQVDSSPVAESNQASGSQGST